MQRIAQALEIENRQHGQDHGEKALHVAGAAAEQAISVTAQAIGVRCPVLPGGRHDVGVSRQDDTGFVLRPKGGPKIGLRAVLRRKAPGLGTQPGKLGLEPFDHRQVRKRAGRVEADHRIEN